MADHGKKKARRRKHQPMGLEILHEDRDIIVVNKAAGLLTMGTGRDGGRTAHAALDDYVKKGNHKSRERIFIVHRLDRDTSGALVFARTEKAKNTLQKNWEDAKKTYLAFVEGHPDPKEGKIASYLAENEARRVQAPGCLLALLRPGNAQYEATQQQIISLANSGIPSKISPCNSKSNTAPSEITFPKLTVCRLKSNKPPARKPS